jgi:transcriptional regulator with XRE-family HTH domain
VDHLDKKRIGATIRALRERAKMTQTALGAAVDPHTGQNLVSRWESGKDLPSVDKITKLAVALHTTTDLLLFGEGEPTGGDEPLREYTIWAKTMAPGDLTDTERTFLASLRWPPNAGVPEPEWYDDALTMLRGVERKAARRRRGPAH